MQALKILVVLMGILIVAGIAVIGVTIYNRLAEGAPEEAATAEETPARDRFGEVELALPEGCEIIDIVVADGRLVVWSGARAGCDRIYIYDLADGTRLGTLTVTGGP